MTSNANEVQATTPPYERSRSSGFGSHSDAGRTESRMTIPVTSKAFASEVPHWLPVDRFFRKKTLDWNYSDDC
jgi:hypothetical protein